MCFSIVAAFLALNEQLSHLRIFSSCTLISCFLKFAGYFATYSHNLQFWGGYTVCTLIWALILKSFLNIFSHFGQGYLTSLLLISACSMVRWSLRACSNAYFVSQRLQLYLKVECLCRMCTYNPLNFNSTSPFSESDFSLWLQPSILQMKVSIPLLWKPSMCFFNSFSEECCFPHKLHKEWTFM